MEYNAVITFRLRSDMNVSGGTPYGVHERNTEELEVGPVGIMSTEYRSGILGLVRATATATSYCATPFSNRTDHFDLSGLHLGLDLRLATSIEIIPTLSWPASSLSASSSSCDIPNFDFLILTACTTDRGFVATVFLHHGGPPPAQRAYPRNAM
jgi:hypothetical protein